MDRSHPQYGLLRTGTGFEQWSIWGPPPSIDTQKSNHIVEFVAGYCNVFSGAWPSGHRLWSNCNKSMWWNCTPYPLIHQTKIEIRIQILVVWALILGPFHLHCQDVEADRALDYDNAGVGLTLTDLISLGFHTAQTSGLSHKITHLVFTLLCYTTWQPWILSNLKTPDMNCTMFSWVDHTDTCLSSTFCTVDRGDENRQRFEVAADIVAQVFVNSSIHHFMPSNH